MIDKTPEVLAPAGDRARLEAALRFGADAVYLGGKLFNMLSLIHICSLWLPLLRGI